MWTLIGVVVGAALVLITPLWYLFAQYIVTLLHECGHTITTILAREFGRNRDLFIMDRVEITYGKGYVRHLLDRENSRGFVTSSGQTTQRVVDPELARGPSFILITFLGYPAPALLALAQTVAAYYFGAHTAVVGMAVFYAILFLACIQIKPFTLLVSGTFLAILVVTAISPSTALATVVLTSLSAVACLGSMRSLLFKRKAVALGETDMDQLAMMTGISADTWTWTMIVTVAASTVVTLLLNLGMGLH